MIVFILLYKIVFSDCHFEAESAIIHIFDNNIIIRFAFKN